jgi:hypothetical protein
MVGLPLLPALLEQARLLLGEKDSCGSQEATQTAREL